MDLARHDNLSNSTSNVIEVNIAYSIFIPAVIFVITAMNLGTIIAFWKLPQLREKPSELLILNLACSDILTGIWVLPLGGPLYITPNHWPFGEIGCAIWILGVDISLHGTLFALITISLDRFLLVYMEYPKYVKTVTFRSVYKVIACGWILTWISGAIEMAFWQQAKSVSEVAASIDYSSYCLSPPRRARGFALCFFLILYLTPVLIVLGLSIAFLYQLHLRLKKTKLLILGHHVNTLHEPSDENQESEASPGHSSDETLDSHPDNNDGAHQIQKTTSKPKPVSRYIRSSRKNRADALIRKRYIKPAITLLGLVSAMAICMLPYSFYVMYSDVASGKHGKTACEICNNPNIIYGLILLQFFNACLDPFIYVVTRKRIRTFYCSLYKRGLQL